LKQLRNHGVDLKPACGAQLSVRSTAKLEQAVQLIEEAMVVVDRDTNPLGCTVVGSVYFVVFPFLSFFLFFFSSFL
jgi:hypothetical protein